MIENAQSLRLLLKCTHCQSECTTPINSADGSEVFCCLGCQSVYSFLNDQGLGQKYYQLLKDGPSFAVSTPAIVRVDKFKYIDQIDFLSEYASTVSVNRMRMTFYIEGIHCLACLWLLEKIPSLSSGVISAKLDLGPSHLNIVIDPAQTSFSKVATLISKLGHAPHPIKDEAEAQHLKKSQERRTLIRIGLSAFCAGNIMVYNAGLYSGASGKIAQSFGLATAVLALPVLTYAALPFYRSALAAVKARQASIDIPISLGLVYGGVVSFYNVLTGNPDNYFDTLTTLVFLVLFSRFALSKLTQNGLDSSEINSFLGEGVYEVSRAGENSTSSRHARTLKKNDSITIKPGQVIPVDGNIVEGHSSLHYALLTGETTPVAKRIGDSVERGALNLDSTLIVEAVRVGNDTKLGEMVEELRQAPHSAPEILTLGNRFSKILITVIPIIALILLISFGALMGDWSTGVSRSLALLVITCPCALGLSIPLSFSLGLKKAQKAGLLVKNEATLEKIMHLDHIAFDKTGTLTEGKLKVIQTDIHAKALVPISDIIYALEKDSLHPIGISLCEELASQVTRFNYELSNRIERPQNGVSATIEGLQYEIRSAKVDAHTKNKLLELSEDSNIIATITLSDRLRVGVAEALEDLRHYAPELHLLSGDQENIVHEQVKNLKIRPKNIHAELLPNDKVNILTSLGKVMMVGDGLNDAYALKSAFIGVAVNGSADASIRSSDVYSLRPGLTPIVDLMKIGVQTSKAIKANIIYSALYNTVAISCACLGLISPLAAAIFMPLSSLSSFVLTLCIMRTKKIVRRTK